jgi:signal transduction histidine kinase
MGTPDRKLADESLQRSEERNRAILRAIPDLMFLQTADGVYLDYQVKGVPARLSQEISLCLYRIAQECLNNAIKHSGARDAKVKLLGTGDEIVLRVSDTGVGFDPDSPAIKRGLGLVGMKERLRLVRGNISVESRPSQGTQITASVPLGTLILG